MSRRILVIDNYDSFTYNLVHYLGELGAEATVYRNDALTVQDAVALEPDAIVISPGPCDPDRAGITVPLIRALAERTPILGVCLGHQAIAQAFGAESAGERAAAPLERHGIELELVGRKDKAGFAVEPRRWKVEQTFGCLLRYRRLQVDHEGGTDMSRTMTLLAALFMTGARFERQIMG